MTPNKKTAPYAAPENVMRVIERVRQTGHKGRIDADYLRQIGINEGMISRTLVALEYIGLVAGGEPTPLFERIKVAFEDEWRAVLQEAVRTAYGDIFRAVDPSVDGRGKVLTAFKPMQPNKQWPRMTTLFLGLCDASGIAVKEPPPNRPGKDAPQKPRERPNGRSQRVARVLALPPPERPSLDPTLTSMLTKLPEIEHPDDLDQWWAMFRTAWMFVKKVKPF